MGQGYSARALRRIALAVLAYGAGCVDDGATPEDESAGGIPVDTGCAVVTCPYAEACCSEVFADADDSQSAGFARRDDLIASFDQSSERVRAEFSFEAPDQRGRVIFNLGRNISLDAIDIASMVQAPGAASVQIGVSSAVTRGCVFGYALTVPGGGTQQMETLALGSDQLCFNGGVPGFGSVIEVGVNAAGPGPGVIEVSNLALSGPDAE